MKIPLLQSQAWQKLQDDLGIVSFFKQTDDYQYLAIKKPTPVGNYLYLPYGPIAKNQTAFRKAIQNLTQLAREENAFFIRIEPQNPDFAHNLKNLKKSQDLNPAETWALNLKGTDDDLTAKLPSRLCRYHKNYPKNGLIIEKSHNPDDIHYLYDLQQALAKEKNISTYSKEYLATELKQPFATLYVVKYQNPETNREEPVAAGLVFDDKTTRYNLQGAQSDLGRHLHATGILTIELIKDAKAKNLETFDFWGIAPDGAPENHPWAGFTAFKKTFAGKEVKYAGTYDLVLNPIKYQIYASLRKIRRKI